MGVLEFLILIITPGFLLYDHLKEDTKETFDVLERWTFIIGSSIAITSLLGILAMCFDAFWLDFFIAVYIVLLIWHIIKKFSRGDRLGQCSHINSRNIAIFVAALLLVTIIYFQPTQYYFGGRDPGIYVNAGACIGKWESLKRHDELIDEVKVNYPGVFADENIKYAGMYLEEEGGMAYTNPQFYHAYSMWLGIGYKLFGADKFLYITPIFALISLLIIFSCVKELFNFKIGAITVGLLSINISQIWYGRGPYSEILSQLVLWFSIYLITKAYKTKDTMLGGVAGLSLVAALLIRLDNIVVFIPLVIFYVLVFVWNKEEIERWMLDSVFTMAGAGAIFLLYVYTFGREYTRFQLITDNSLIPANMGLRQLFVLGAVGAVVAVLVVYILRNLISKIVEFIADRKDILIKIFSVVVVVAFVYMYFIRPKTTSPHMHVFGTVRTYREESLIRLGWYVSQAGIWIGLVGFLLFINKRMEDYHLFFMLLVLLNFTVFLYDPKIYPDHFWAVRRFVPFIIPAYMVFIAYLIYISGRVQLKWKKIKVVSLGLIIGLAISYTMTAYPFLLHTEYGGAGEGMDRLAERFDTRDIIIATDTNYTARLVGTPLDIIYDKNVLPLRDEYDVENLERFVANKRDRGYNVYFLSNSSDEYVECRNHYFDYIDTVSIKTRNAETSFEHIPKDIYTKDLSVNIYRFLPGDEKVDNREYVIDIGAPTDINYRLEDFYGVEGNLDDNYRWTGANPRIEMKLMEPIDPEAETCEMVIRSAHFLPEDMEEEEVDIYINGYRIATIDVAKEPDEQKLSFPSHILRGEGTLSIELSTKAWSPKELKVGEDERELGLMIDWIKIAY